MKGGTGRLNRKTSDPYQSPGKSRKHGADRPGNKNAAKIAKTGVLFAASAAEHDEQNDVATDQVRALCQNDVATDQVRALCRCLPHFDNFDT